ncbi:hypothetical protein BOX15_Mlig014947g1 [Macrostomum lignano]|uniref:Uncharacterized protein n=1 Tax=Macrostomum lignano TaxID=282301 RepID=A0A267H8A4_9PLAT|nr:hypothetical protein BOX15_Mlig014947g2 [Macrostomum lignano]PAA93782.1 hypothetical protein BOX15_Mlig014947g1 [Macrostomum lignano]
MDKDKDANQSASQPKPQAGGQAKGGDAQQQQKTGGYSGKGTKADLDNHSNQLNPNNELYKEPQSK